MKNKIFNQFRAPSKNLLMEIVTALLTLMFGYAAFSKLMDIDQTIFEMGRQPFPRSIVAVMAYAIPLLELMIIGMLLFKATRIIGLYASLIILTIFTLYIVLGLLHVFKKVPCSCGGIISEFTWKEHLLFNLFFIAITYFALRMRKILPNTKKNEIIDTAVFT